MKSILTIAVLLSCGVMYAGELSPAQKTSAAQKNATQSAAQKSTNVERSGFFARRRALRLQFRAERGTRLRATSCSSGGCG